MSGKDGNHCGDRASCSGGRASTSVKGASYCGDRDSCSGGRASTSGKDGSHCGDRDSCSGSRPGHLAVRSHTLVSCPTTNQTRRGSTSLYHTGCLSVCSS